MVEMHPVRSEAISAIGHDAKTGEVHVAFRSGGLHKFGPFGAEDFQRFKQAESIGKHFHASIRPKAIKK
jgi:hypothetical protein